MTKGEKCPGREGGLTIHSHLSVLELNSDNQHRPLTEGAWLTPKRRAQQ